MPSAPRAPSPEAFAAPADMEKSLVNEELAVTSRKILDILNRYKLRVTKNTQVRAEEGNAKFLAQIYRQVLAGKTIRMCLPAFPFKSPNAKAKVLGHLPDKAEEFALARLNGLCAAIQDVYSPGAKLVIVSDGLVYNDLLGVPEKNVWAYGEALRKLCADKGYSSNIEFARLKHLTKHNNLPDGEMDEITYVANSSNFRLALLSQHGRSDYDPSAQIANSEDTCLTYRGYLKFLETDLATVFPIGLHRSKSKFKKGMQYIAKQMLIRGDAFAQAVRENFEDHIRLSIHPSTGDNKLSINLLPTDTDFTTPWHCAIAFNVDGTSTTAPRNQFDNNPDYELVYEGGRPSHYRQRSDLYNWDTCEVTFEPLYPCGVVVRPAGGQPARSIDDVDTVKARALSERNSPVILRGFEKTDQRELFVAKAHDLGTPLPWKFGLVLEVKDKGNQDGGLNNVLSAEWMPFHFDGLFKTKTITLQDGKQKLIPDPPRFQFFTSITPSPKDTGFTLFSLSTFVFKYLPSHLPLSRLQTLTWTCRTGGFDNTVLENIPLVQNHPTTGQPCLRYHEPWPQSKTAFQPTDVTIDGVDAKESAEICEILDGLLHDRRVALYQVWEKGDMLISDNILAMHTRSDFRSGADRELWRIHFD